MPKLSEFERIQVITLREEGWTVQDLMNRFHVARSTIQKLLKKYREEQQIADRARSGRPRRSTAREDRLLRRMSVDNPRLVARGLRQRWNHEYGVEASLTTVRYRLRELGLPGRIAKRKPQLTAQHRRNRLQWCRQHTNWTREQWQLCFFSDETPINLIQPNQRRYIRSPPQRRLEPSCLRPSTARGGGSFMIWAGFAAVGMSALTRIEGTISAVSYTDILNDHLLPLQLPEHGIIFQQDNATPHKSRHTLQWLADHYIEVLSWPAMSPDLNPIENAWGYLKERLEQRQIRNMANLWTVVQEEWASITQELFTQLANSMPDRIQAVIVANGGHTKY